MAAFSASQQPTILPINKPLSLIPVGLKEAALDSPSFRSTVVHFADQIDAVEKWLDGYVKAASKLAQEVGVLEDVVDGFLTASNPPKGLSEAVLDHDYTVLAIRRYGQGAHEFWSHAIGGFKKSQYSVIEPIRATLANNFSPFKSTRKMLDTTQKNYDALLSRYASQAKTKEASSLREDAFQVHEARKSYIKASMDFCIAAPQLRAALDTLLIKVFSDQWLEMKDLRETTTTMFGGFGQEIERIRYWSQQINQGEAALRRELSVTRKQIEDSAEVAMRPSRDLEEYSVPTAPSLLSARPRANSRVAAEGSSAASKQGWLFMRTISGRPARTTWTRRWFFVKNGVFGWLTQGTRSGGVEESEKIGVLLCSVRAAGQEDRRFCFEVKTKDTMLMLQAETPSELARWLSVFDAAKKKALEDPVLGDAQLKKQLPANDAAFAVYPAVSPELAAKRADGQIAGISEEMVSSISTSDFEASGYNRSNPDLTSRRRRTVNSEGDSSREHAAKILSKLDIHRKSIVAPVGSSKTIPATITPSPAPYSGITSLSTTRNSVPLPYGLQQSESGRSNGNAGGASTLAPTNIANPPVPTNLSKTAVMVVAERGLDPGLADSSSGGAPSSLLANQWGTANYGHISRLERGEIPRSREKTATMAPLVPSRTGQGPDAVQGQESAIIAVPGHRKTLSDAEVPAMQSQPPLGPVDYPGFYPSSLRIHDAQLRLLFPNIPPEEKVLLVFRASWNPSENRDLPGRVYVTSNDIYFYSHYHGFVLVTGFSLSRVVDISTEAGRHQDYLYFTLREMHGRDEVHTVTIKIFLEPLQLLRRRLEYIVSSFNSEEPVGLEELLATLINLDNDVLDNAPDVDDWEHVTRSRYLDARPSRSSREQKMNLRIDRSLYGGDSASPADADALKFKLPAQPVNYVPQDVDVLVTDVVLGISAKAMFHILFGDKSAVSQMLYFQRRTQVIKQYPWISGEGSHWSRRFEYNVIVKDIRGRNEDILIVDSQTIDVLNEHLCYCVTDLKTPWHLPRPKDFSLMTKVVITHVAKSKCKLAIYIKVKWHKRSGFSDNIIEKHALQDLRQDAAELNAMITDQVAKLSKTDAQTRRVIEIFGHLGQVQEPTQFTSPNLKALGRPTPPRITQRTMGDLSGEAAVSFLQAAMSSSFSAAINAAQSFGKHFGGHGILLTLLSLSVLMQLLASTTLVQSWWTDRSAAAHLSRLGIKPDLVMSKAVYLHDVYDFTTPPQPQVGNDSNQCSDTFRKLLAITNLDTAIDHNDLTYSEPSARSTARRLRKTRQRMGAYRHDLLVSLRLINSIEQETVQAEYENWLSEENVKCDHVGEILKTYEVRNDGGVSGVDDEREDIVARLTRLRTWQEGYCGSCRSERKLLLRR